MNINVKMIKQMTRNEIDEKVKEFLIDDLEIDEENTAWFVPQGF